MTSFMTVTDGTTTNVGMTDSLREAVCDRAGCSNEAASFESEQTMFICKTQRSTRGHPTTTPIIYVSSTITIPGTDDRYHFTLAGDTGLVYTQYAEGAYRIWHLAAKRVLSNWVITSERDARTWIERLVQLADWTGEQPQLHTTSDLTELLINASITTLLQSGDVYTMCSSDHLTKIDVVSMENTATVEKEAPTAIFYTPCTIMFSDAFAAGYPMDVIAAGDTGLGYVKCGGSFTIVHIPTQHVLILDWFVEREDLAKIWVKELVALADWTGTVPKFRNADSLKEIIAYACIGMLTEGNMNIGQISSTVL